ncbi:MAG: rod shape-determining protein RodA [Alphaproteobacteria bacterium]|nr:rod shape-determining protein RodA [Alphaproteobacteria bacterium]
MRILPYQAVYQTEMTLRQRLWQINWSLIFLITVIGGVGIAMLYSAGGGAMDPWASKQLGRFALGLIGMFIVAVIDIRIWLRYAYVIFGISVAMLIAVDVIGHIGMGAQRWLRFGPLSVQPSEVMKMALVLALARYFHRVNIEDIGRPVFLIAPLAMVLAPVALVMKQPDLGTAVMLMAGGGAIFFLAGVRLWKFAVVIVVGLACIPIGWNFMHDYQRQRVLTFINPETDPLGAGYHILQSQIAFGSGSVFGKGYLQGTQSHLNFLPERHTDFIFTMLAEEFGLVGGLMVLLLFALLMVYGLAVSVRCRNHFGRLLSMGVTVTILLYVFINTAMVMGLIPVVGVPLPLISYGGTAMLTVLGGCGFLMNAYIHRDVRIGRHAGES